MYTPPAETHRPEDSGALIEEKISGSWICERKNPGVQRKKEYCLFCQRTAGAYSMKTGWLSAY
jgi:hypothetical protein